MTYPLDRYVSDLPIYEYGNVITDAIDNNQVTIITAETGAGKSTQVPQYLAAHGYRKVIVTQPRILAARNLSKRVREEWALRTSTDSEPVIGYRTANERNDSASTQILFCTDGLQLVREISGEGTLQRQVLILDEVHEWNENMEVLIAWAKKRCREEPTFKVVIMSATIDTTPLARFFNTESVITVPGRSYPVTQRRGTGVVSEILQKLRSSSSNILVFLPGKSEIQDVAEAISKKATAANVPVIPLHSQLEAADQQQAFSHYPNGKVILSTNIAQTSVTIDDIDVVIDSGLERRSEVRNGVEGLFISQVSQADCLQRAGRAGRTKAGEYILAPYDTLPCLPIEDRSQYGTPEILRKHIDRLTLRLANVGIDIEQLDFFHAPSKQAIKRAKQTLIALGAMRHNGSITDIGKAMERYPVESSYARMIVESQSYTTEVQSKLAAIIAIQEVGGIVKGSTRFSGWQRLTKQKKSDLLAHYDVYLALANIDSDEYEELGIIAKNVDKASEVMGRLGRDLHGVELTPEFLTPIAAAVEGDLLRCIVAGQIDQVWSIDDRNNAIHAASGEVRELSGNTVVRNSKLITGTPFDLQVPTRDGALQTLHLVQGITSVDTQWLLDFAPGVFTAKQGKMGYDPRSGTLITRQQLRAGKRTFEGSGVPATQNTKQNQRLFQDAFAAWAHEQIEQERRKLGGLNGRRVPTVPLHHIKTKVKAYAGNAINLESLPPERRAQLLDLAKLTTHLGADAINRLAALARKSHTPGRHNAHRGWKPAHKRGGKAVKRRKW